MYVVGFSKKMTFLARAIMWFTKSHTSHTYVRQGDTETGYVFESDERGANNQWAPVFYREGSGNIIVEEYLIELPDELLNDGWDVTQRQHLNQKYGYLQLVGDAISILVEWAFKKKVKNPFGNAYTVVCSELVLAFLVNSDIPGFADMDPELVSPEDLLEVIHTMPATFQRLT